MSRNTEVALVKLCKKDPVFFVRNLLGIEPDAWQKDVLRAAASNNRIALCSCKGPGKTATLSWLAWWFLFTRVNCNIAAASISGDNLRDCLWKEMSKSQGRCKFLLDNYDMQAERIFYKGRFKDWFMSARKWSKTADRNQQADTLAGIHADSLMFILDEAGGMPDAVMAAAEAGLATGGDKLLVIAGNPTQREGPLWRACTSERDLWHVTEITGDPDDPKRSPRVDIEWARQQIAKYGADDPFVMVNVFGKFPPQSINALIGPDEVAEAMKRNAPDDSYIYAQKRIGVDVARFGDDLIVLFPRQGLVAFPPAEYRNMRSNEIAAKVALAKQQWGSELEFIDDTGGYGSGVVDSMIQAGLSPIPINFSSKATDARYFNKRSEMWFNMMEWIKRGGSLPNHRDLAEELSNVNYTYQNGKFRLEEKDAIKQRIGRSPNYADALCLTFSMPEVQSQQQPGFDRLPSVRRAQCDYDPLDERRP